MRKGKIQLRFENLEIYKRLQSIQNHSTVTGWQELFFPYKSF